MLKEASRAELATKPAAWGWEQGLCLGSHRQVPAGKMRGGGRQPPGLGVGSTLLARPGAA